MYLVAPAGGDVVDGVPAATEEQQRRVEAPHEADAAGVAVDGQVQVAEPIAGEPVAATLHHVDARIGHGVRVVLQPPTISSIRIGDPSCESGSHYQYHSRSVLLIGVPFGAKKLGENDSF